jgi:hypothetical protein
MRAISSRSTGLSRKARIERRDVMAASTASWLGLLIMGISLAS